MVAPSSRPNVPIAVMCEAIRLSSIIRTRRMLARSGISASTPSSFSTARQYTVSLKKGER